MAWVAVTKHGREFISMCKPIRVTDEDNYYGWKDTFTEVSLFSGALRNSSEQNCLFPMNLSNLNNCILCIDR